jgi:dCTP deaminase
MILADKEILAQIETGDIVIKPFNRARLGSNSFDVTLSKHLAIYNSGVLDCALSQEIVRFEIPKEGFVLQPNELYLASTNEYTESHKTVPFLEGKSSVGRLGISIHITAGKGDVGYCGFWTMEIMVVKPIRVYADMPIAQLIYHECTEANVVYSKKESAKYSDIEGLNNMPIESKMYNNFPQVRYVDYRENYHKVKSNRVFSKKGFNKPFVGIGCAVLDDTLYLICVFSEVEMTILEVYKRCITYRCEKVGIDSNCREELVFLRQNGIDCIGIDCDVNSAIEFMRNKKVCILNYMGNGYADALFSAANRLLGSESIDNLNNYEYAVILAINHLQKHEKE